MAVTRMYVPEIGQSDAAARAAALNAGLSVADTADAPRYHMIKGHLPAVVLENGEQIVAISEPTTLAAVDQAASDLAALTPDIQAGAAAPPISLSLNEAAELIVVEVKMPDGSTKTGVVPLL